MAALSPGFRSVPRVTANQLALFMVSTETRRRSILRDARKIGGAAAIRYSDLRKVARAHLADPHRSKERLNTAHSAFERRANDASQSPFVRDDARSSIASLESFRRMSANRFGPLDFLGVPDVQPLLVVGKVEVSVNLDALIRRASGPDEEVGGALFRFAQPEKSERENVLRREAARYSASLVYWQVSANYAQGRKPNHKLCYLIEPNSDEMTEAPGNYAKRIKDMTLACEVIAALWNSV